MQSFIAFNCLTFFILSCPNCLILTLSLSDFNDVTLQQASDLFIAALRNVLDDNQQDHFNIEKCAYSDDKVVHDS